MSHRTVSSRPNICIRFARYARVAAWLMLTIAPGAVAAGYSVSDGVILDPSGERVPIRGISHFGFQGKTLQPQYLWMMSWKKQIAQIKQLGFNAIRVPFAPATLYFNAPTQKAGYFDPKL